MNLTKPNQDLRRDLIAAASALENAVHDLFREAQTYSEADFLIAMERIERLHNHADRLRRYGEEVRDGVISRASAG